MSRRLWAFLALALAALAPAAGQEVVYLAFGDSLTEGVGDNSVPGGYPPRLQRLLRREGQEATVLNFGVSGEGTFAGLSRISSVLSGGGDCLLLMEGTNDVPRIFRGEVSIETVVDNLDRMAQISSGAGVRPYLATLPPRFPAAIVDSRNTTTLEVVWEILELAFQTNRFLVDVWQGFDPFENPKIFDRYYADDPEDRVGHPNPEGYDRMAGIFADAILKRDVVPPVPGRIAPLGFEVPPDSEIRVTLYEPRPGSGIRLNDTSLVVNRRSVHEPEPSSNRRKAVLVHGRAGRRACRAVVEARSSDRSDPPNVLRRRLAVYTFPGVEVLDGDADSDCRVDGRDLIYFALAFGSRVGKARYDPLLDFNSDGVIDGEDLAALANNFGRSSD